MHFVARRLAHDAQTRSFMSLHNRSRRMRQILCAMRAGADVFKQAVHGLRFFDFRRIENLRARHLREFRQRVR
jgi:hypothetical protein